VRLFAALVDAEFAGLAHVRIVDLVGQDDGPAGIDAGRAGPGVDGDHEFLVAVVVDVGQGIAGDRALDATGLPQEVHAHAVPVQGVDLALGEGAVGLEELGGQRDVLAHQHIGPVILVQVGHKDGQRDVIVVPEVVGAGLVHGRHQGIEFQADGRAAVLFLGGGHAFSLGGEDHEVVLVVV